MGRSSWKVSWTSLIVAVPSSSMCLALGPALETKLKEPSYVSDIFSLIGTTFLWLFWPSFVAGLVPAGVNGHAYALINTVLALVGSTVVTFGLAPLLNGN